VTASFKDNSKAYMYSTWYFLCQKHHERHYAEIKEALEEEQIWERDGEDAEDERISEILNRFTPQKHKKEEKETENVIIDVHG